MNNVIPKLSVLLRLLLVAPIYIVALVLFYYSPKKNYWNKYQGFTLGTCFICFAYKNPRLLHALNIAYKYEKRYVQIPTKPRAIQGTTSIRHPQYGLWAIFENKNNI